VVGNKGICRRKERGKGKSKKRVSNDLNPTARGISFSRRTDAACFPDFLLSRKEAGWVEYIPLGPSRRKWRSHRPEFVTHLCLWTKNLGALLRVVDRLIERGIRCLFHITITGLGGTPVEPNVPRFAQVVADVKKLAKKLPAGAIVWRFDPIFITEKYTQEFHVSNFRRLAKDLAGHVDRVVASFAEERRSAVTKKIKEYAAKTRDCWVDPEDPEKVALVKKLRKIAKASGLEFTLCCNEQLRVDTGCPPIGCNTLEQAARVYPELRDFPPLKKKPTRDGCYCDEEWDIGCDDCCPHSCVYCYFTKSGELAAKNLKLHDPTASCLIPTLAKS